MFMKTNSKTLSETNLACPCGLAV